MNSGNKILANLFFGLSLVMLLSCEKDGGNEQPERGFLSGKVTDTKGSPLAGVKIIIDNTIVWNSNIQTATDAAGKYKAKLTTGSWMPYAILTKTYNGKTYELYLDPDTIAGFDLNGGVCNFRWKLTGDKKAPLTGTYGGTILLTRAVGSTLFDSENIEYTLTPAGNLVDGSAGQVLKLRESSSFPQLSDVPLGRYQVTAVYKSAAGDKPLKLRNFYAQAEGFVSVLTLDFEPETIDGDNIASIEYRE